VLDDLNSRLVVNRKWGKARNVIVQLFEEAVVYSDLVLEIDISRAVEADSR